jgi:8-oxo-dGTP diphosphatase
MEKDITTHVVAVFAIVQKGNKFLIAKRSSNDPQAGGQWAFPGGKVGMELGDNVLQKNLRREVLEETGVEITDKIDYLANEGFIRVSGHHVVALTFLCHWKSGTAKPLEDQDEIRWMTISEIKSMIKEFPDHTQDRLQSLFEYLKKTNS